jgi:hypothetical protein
MNYLQAIHLPEEGQSRNHEIQKAYFKILQQLNELSKSFPTDSLRTRIEIDHKQNPNSDYEVYQLLTPCLSLELNADPKGSFYIAYALNDSATRYLGQPLFTKLVRIIYHNTNSVVTAINIEDCLEYFPYYYEVYYDALQAARNQDYDFYTSN